MRAHDDLQALRRGVGRDPLEPRELLRADSPVPVLRLRQLARLHPGELRRGGRLRGAAGERRIRAHLPGIEDDETEAGAIEEAVARGDAEPGVDLRFLPVQQGEIVIAEHMLPAVSAGRHGLHDRVEAAPLAVDGVTEVDAEIQRAPVEMFDRGAELGDRSAVAARPAVRDVGVLRIGDDPDLEAFVPRGAADERRDGQSEGELTQETTAGQRRRHASIKHARDFPPMKKGGIAPALSDRNSA